MELLRELVNLNCISGFEYLDSGYLAYILDGLCDSTETDGMGNIIGYISANIPDSPTVMLTAHYDMIGLIVTEIKEEGYVKFAAVGGIDERILPGQEVTLHGKESIYGIIGIRPPHILTAEDMKKAETVETLAIDTGLSTEELKKIIKVGTPVSFKGKLRPLGKNEVTAGALDNRAGCYAILRAVEGIKDRLKVNLKIMFTTGEETGRSGAKTGVNAGSPDLAVVVDGTFGKTPELDASNSNKMGAGPVICKGPSLNRAYVKQILAVAENYQIPYQVEVESGDTGTDAFVIETAGCGIPCLLVSIPLKYMHTTVETADISDIENTAELIEKFLKDFSEVEYA